MWAGMSSGPSSVCVQYAASSGTAASKKASKSARTSGEAFSLSVSAAEVCWMNRCSSPRAHLAELGQRRGHLTGDEVEAARAGLEDEVALEPHAGGEATRPCRHPDQPAAECVRVGDPLLALLMGEDGLHWQAEPLDLAHEIAPQPLRRPLGQGRDDDLVEVPVAHGLLDGGEGVGPADQPLDRAAGGAPQQRDRVLERPVGLLAIGDVRDEDGELARSAQAPLAHLLQQPVGGRGAVGHDEDPLGRGRVHLDLL